MRIGLISTHSFPIPYRTHTGDVVILDLAHGLSNLGHEVYLFAPDGTEPPPYGKQFTMPCSFGAAASPAKFEAECYDLNHEALKSCDIVHDFSVNKTIMDKLRADNYTKTICTYLGGNWSHPVTPQNAIVWSHTMRDRALRGATDYENTPTPDMGGKPHRPLKDAHIIYGGVDTNYYTPTTYQKEDFFLWMNRWHPAKGYSVAIELAKKTGMNLILAGEHPNNEVFEYQKNCALEAVTLANGCANIKFAFLPPDPDHHTAKIDLYRKAKALLYTGQFQEPFGLSQAEALACGTPVIGINFGSVPEVVTDKLTGYVVNNNIDELAQAVKNIDKIDPRVCRTEAVRRFDRNVMALSYIKEYQQIISGKSW